MTFLCLTVKVPFLVIINPKQKELCRNAHLSVKTIFSFSYSIAPLVCVCICMHACMHSWMHFLCGDMDTRREPWVAHLSTCLFF